MNNLQVKGGKDFVEEILASLNILQLKREQDGILSCLVQQLDAKLLRY